MPQAQIDELRRRLAMTRWPGRETVADGSQGVRLESLQKLIGHWGSDYDWRRGEARLNRLPQFVTRIDGVDIHFIHVRSRHADALPLIMTHGWPGSVFELLNTVAPLTDPTAHGGLREDAFHLVLPSMPGYGFSSQPGDTGWNAERITAEAAFGQRRRGIEVRMVVQSERSRAPDLTLVRMVHRATSWVEKLREGAAVSSLAAAENVQVPFISRRIHLGLLSPKIVTAIVEGRLPAHLTAQALIDMNLSMDWREQEAKLLGGA